MKHALTKGQASRLKAGAMWGTGCALEGLEEERAFLLDIDGRVKG